MSIAELYVDHIANTAIGGSKFSMHHVNALELL